ncbi:MULTISPECIES: restriction endonuclease subunit S [unclassified Microbacterium]|uniref:restriction endonuclease subunit S n=1 Tax=unclassified Microbacterium TaxID=2609290 RepID=UPI00214C225F|nr:MULTISPECIES: restriction endonuclease subunit S [unclassified Microbacterium]MCR2810649.1 restriction endonuclease subunit S [Microbacterium sp. zg.B185]WIM18186.1 restriction endonuclease subunit S [Microbacterium sp. zg-B185]
MPHEPLDLDYVRLALTGLSPVWRRAARGHIPGIRREDVLSAEVSVPPFDEQPEIARAAFRLLASLDESQSDLEQALVESVSEREALFTRVLRGSRPDESRTLISVGNDSDSPLLSEIAELKTGHTPSRSNSAYWNGGIPWLGIADARDNDGEIVTETARTVTEEGIANSSAVVLPVGTVSLSRTASIGYVVQLGLPMCTSQDFANWVCGDDLDPDWLQLVLVHARPFLQTLGQGATIRTIYMRELRRLRIDAPSWEEQQQQALELKSKLRKLDQAASVTRDALGAIGPARRRVIANAIEGQTSAQIAFDPGTLRPVALNLPERIGAELGKPKSLLEVVRENASGVSPETAFNDAGFDASRAHLFFDRLAQLIDEGVVAYDHSQERIVAVR